MLRRLSSFVVSSSFLAVLCMLLFAAETLWLMRNQCGSLAFMPVHATSDYHMLLRQLMLRIVGRETRLGCL